MFILGTVSGGDELVIVGRTADSSWYQVQTAVGNGWVYGEYIATRNEYGGSPVTTSSATNAAVSGPYGIINTGALNIRSGPGAQYTSLGALAGGTETRIIGRNADWSWWLLETPLGASLLQQESRVVEECFDGVFGEQCLQLGNWGDPRTFVRFARTQRCALIAEERWGEGPSAIGQLHRLPIESDSIDSVILPPTS